MASPAVYAFVKQRGIFISGIPSYFIRLQQLQGVFIKVKLQTEYD